MKLEQLAQELNMDPEDLKEVMRAVNTYTKKEGFKLEVVNDFVFYVDIKTDTTQMITSTDTIKEIISKLTDPKIRETAKIIREAFNKKEGGD